MWPIYPERSVFSIGIFSALGVLQIHSIPDPTLWVFDSRAVLPGISRQDCWSVSTASSSKRGSSEWTGPPSRTAKKVRSAKVIFPTGWAIPTISGQNSVLTLEGMSRALWRSMVWASSRRFGDSEFWNYHCEREWISAKPDINFFSPSLPRNWMQQRKNAIDDDGEVVKLDRKMAVTLNWMALWRPDLVLLIEGFDFPFKKVVVISELGKIT